MIILAIDKINTMKKLITLLSLSISIAGFAQIYEEGEELQNNNKWTYGGGLGVGFGSNSSFYLQASPRVGYKVTNDLEVGGMGSISWATSSYDKSSMFGVGPYINYYVGRSFFVSGNLQQYFYNYKNKYVDYKISSDETALYVGGGYLQRISNNSYMQIGAMYNVLWKQNSSIMSTALVPTMGIVIGL